MHYSLIVTEVAEMPKFASDTRYTRVGLETELNVTVFGQNLFYDRILFASGKTISVGGQLFPVIIFAIDHPSDGQKKAILEVKTAPIILDKAANINQKITSAIKATFADGKSYLGNDLRATFNIKLQNEGLKDFVIGAIDDDANKFKYTAGRTFLNKGRQVNVSVPFVDICSENGIIMGQPWPNSAAKGGDSIPKRKFRAAIHCATAICGRVPAIKPTGVTRDLRKVRSLLTLFFFNALVVVQASQVGSGDMLNKDSWGWLPKIRISQAKTVILSPADKEYCMQLWRDLGTNRVAFLNTIDLALAPFRFLVNNPDVFYESLRALLYFPECETPAENWEIKDFDIYTFNDLRTAPLGDTMTGKPIAPYKAPIVSNSGEAIPNHSSYMVVFEIRKIGQNAGEFAHKFSW
jgi:hypothetical protein